MAKRAGIAKGTIYLYFADKESLFQELIRAKMVPVVGSLELALATGLPLRTIVEQDALDKAQSTILEALQSDDPQTRLNAATLMLRSRQARERGWS